MSFALTTHLIIKKNDRLKHGFNSDILILNHMLLMHNVRMRNFIKKIFGSNSRELFPR